jgi:anthranilate synthase component 1
MVLLGQTAYVQAGAGLVADSVPASEYQETVDKAMSLLRAIEVAETQL